jgi:hypothetical protein
MLKSEWKPVFRIFREAAKCSVDYPAICGRFPEDGLMETPVLNLNSV